MAYDAQGNWSTEDDSVANRLPGLLATNNPLMKQARTDASRVSNSRGLLNSSINSQAGEAAALGVALPVASQDASQTAQKDMQASQLGSTERIANMNVASNDREKATAAAAAFENTYNQGFSTIGQNADLPADVRNEYLNHLSAIRDSNLNMLEQLYNVDLTWASPTV